MEHTAAAGGSPAAAVMFSAEKSTGPGSLPLGLVLTSACNDSTGAALACAAIAPECS